MIQRYAFVLFLFLTPALMFGGVGMEKSAPRVTAKPDTSSPDAWGYTWVRSNQPGGPTFRWIDLTTRPTAVNVTGLGDDNFVGPFPMLMSFPYYWYTVSSFWIGSNGYINFSSPANFASPFAQLPNTATPNDLLAICTGDLDFGITASNPRCLYWTNGNDSLVVSFINVTEWQTTPNPNLRHTFQVILNRADSSITYQYGLQQGRFNAPNNTTLCIGMENATGQIGLSYTFSTTPPHALLPDSGIAIKWKRTVNTGLAVTDVGTVGGFNPLNQGKIIRAGVADTIQAIVRNFGTVNLTNVRVTAQISRGLEVYRDTVFIAALNASQQTTVTFPRLFSPTATGTYTALFSSFVAGDVGPGNNNKTTEIVVLPFAIGQSTRLQFEAGTVGGSINWTGGGGMGVAFDLPPAVYPVRIESVFVQISSITAQPMTVQILDGSSGAPGAVLAERNVTAVVGLNTINFTSDSVRIRGGRFFIGGRGQMAWSYETTPPIANRSWEFTGGWAPYRSSDLQDVIMRVTVRPEAPRINDTLLVVLHDSTLGTATEILKRKADRDTLLAYLRALVPRMRVVYIDSSQARFPNLTNYDRMLIGETSFDALQCRWLGAASRQALKDWLNSGTPTAKKSLIMIGADLSYNYSRTGSGSQDTVLAHQMLKHIYLLDNANVTGQNSITGVNLNTGIVLPYSTAPPGGGFYPDGVRPVSGGSVLYRYTGRSATDSVAGIGFSAPGYIAASLFLDPRYFTVSGANTGFGVPLRSLLQYTSVITDVRQVSHEVPNEFSLAQNYPNPFNPTTTIQYSIPYAAQVNVAIYNMLGQRIAELANEVQSPGSYQVVWDARNNSNQHVASGVYFYRLEARPLGGGSPFTSVKKMMFLK